MEDDARRNSDEVQTDHYARVVVSMMQNAMMNEVTMRCERSEVNAYARVKVGNQDVKL